MKPLLGACLLLPALALAEDTLRVPLPDLSQNPLDELAGFLPELALAIALAQGCPDITVTPEDLALMEGSAALIAARLQVSEQDYDTLYRRPAQEQVTQPDVCQVRRFEVWLKLGILEGARSRAALP